MEGQTKLPLDDVAAILDRLAAVVIDAAELVRRAAGDTGAVVLAFPEPDPPPAPELPFAKTTRTYAVKRFLESVDNGDPQATSILRVVEAHGYAIRNVEAPRVIRAVDTLARIVDRHGIPILNATLDVHSRAWGSARKTKDARAGLHGPWLSAIAAYLAAPDASATDVGRALARTRVAALDRAAKRSDVRPMMAARVAVIAALVDQDATA